MTSNTVFYGHTGKSCGICDENTWKCSQRKSLVGNNLWGIDCKMFYWWLFRKISIKFFPRHYKQLLFSKFWEGLLQKLLTNCGFRLSTSSRKAILSFVDRPLKHSETRCGDSGKVHTLTKPFWENNVLSLDDSDAHFYWSIASLFRINQEHFIK